MVFITRIPQWSCLSVTFWVHTLTNISFCSLWISRLWILPQLNIFRWKYGLLRQLTSGTCYRRHCRFGNFITWITDIILRDQTWRLTRLRSHDSFVGHRRWLLQRIWTGVLLLYNLQLCGRWSIRRIKWRCHWISWFVLFNARFCKGPIRLKRAFKSRLLIAKFLLGNFLLMFFGTLHRRILLRWRLHLLTFLRWMSLSTLSKLIIDFFNLWVIFFIIIFFINIFNILRFVWADGLRRCSFNFFNVLILVFEVNNRLLLNRIVFRPYRQISGRT